MIKVKNSSDKITPFCGIALVQENICKNSILHTINETFGCRPQEANNKRKVYWNMTIPLLRQINIGDICYHKESGYQHNCLYR